MEFSQLVLKDIELLVSSAKNYNLNNYKSTSTVFASKISICIGTCVCFLH